MADDRQHDDGRLQQLTGPATHEETGSRIDTVPDRSFGIIHPKGRRCSVLFQAGHASDQIKTFAPIRWADDTAPDEVTVHGDATAVAMNEAKRRGWI